MTNAFKYTLITFIFIFSNCTQKNNTDENYLIAEKLSQIKGVSFITEKGDSIYKQCFKLEVEQPVNHNDTNSVTFKQTVYLSHLDLSRPTVLFINGYSIRASYISEIANLIGANQVYIEHRYFGNSSPKKINWKYLNIEQASADYHRIIEILKPIYKGKWLSSGISKGGQTTMYHRFYYPKDIDVSIPYVAPLNFSAQEKRLISFFDNVGSKECRDKIKNFQKILLQNKEKILPEFEKNATNKNYTFNILGLEKAFEYSVLEYEFAFWQWQFCSCNNIPTKFENPEKLITHMENVDAISFFSDESIKTYQPFFYQALTEIGFYSYNTSNFKGLLKYANNPDFNFTLPEGISVNFNDTLMHSVNKYLQKNANNFIYIYGENDPWSAPAVELIEEKTNSFKMIKKGGSHRTRISSFENQEKNRIIDSLNKWLNIDIAKFN
ncbi:MAG: peptidase [Bacteroidales bacterium]|nr:peptidase [Bacteroidales bacterium]MBN2756388.1 peptidase [Bacteroidales bacterium]